VQAASDKRQWDSQVQDAAYDQLVPSDPQAVKERQAALARGQRATYKYGLPFPDIPLSEIQQLALKSNGNKGT
jgi:hypothetical protein